MANAILGNPFGINLDVENNGNASIKIPGLPGFSIAGAGPSSSNQFNINNFIQNLNRHNEVAHTNKFDITMVPPASVASYVGLSPADMTKGLSLQCEVSELPGRDIEMAEYTTHAFVRRVPHRNQYGAANFTFICTGDMWEKKMFDSWMDLLVPVQTGLVNYPVNNSGQNMYETDVIVNQYDNLGNLIYAATMIDAMPTNMAQLNQSWDGDSIHRLNVTFMFRKWTTVNTTYTSSLTSTGGLLPPDAAGFLSTAISAGQLGSTALSVAKGQSALSTALNTQNFNTLKSII